MVHHSYPIQMEIAGSTAMWTRPDSGDSPVSYPAPTYSACKGIFESILFGPDVEIIPTRVEICAPVQFHSYATNYKGPLRQKKSIDLGNAYQMYSTVLIDVCYRLYAVVVPNHRKDTLSEKTPEWDRRTTSPGHAYQEIFNRRLQRAVLCYSLVGLERVYGQLLWPLPGRDKGMYRYGGYSHSFHAAAGISRWAQIEGFVPL